MELALVPNSLPAMRQRLYFPNSRHLKLVVLVFVKDSRSSFVRVQWKHLQTEVARAKECKWKQAPVADATV